MKGNLNKIGRYVQFPLSRVHIELTNICNFNCIFCPKSIMTREKGYMRYDLVKRIIDELAENNITEKITFHIMGEPFMHPNIFDAMEYGIKRGIKIGLTTNGSYLTPENSDKLIRIGIDQINISLQTPDEDSFRLRRAKDLTFERYSQQTIDYIRDLRKDHEEKIVKIHFLNTKYSGSVRPAIGEINVINDTKTLQERMKIWTKRIYQIEGIKDRITEDRVLKGIDRITINRWNVLEIAPNIFFETYLLDNWGNAMAKRPVVKGRFGYCSALTDHFGILWNGDFVLCCRDFDGKTIMGNVNNLRIIDILNSEEVVFIVKGFKRFRIIHPYCMRCIGGSSLASSILRQVNSIFLWKILKGYFYYQRRLF
ncbi:MAG: radical SAM protein [Nitrospinae bacterium]|nr:radical SAM protein [Nitrospinota bacterium]